MSADQLRRAAAKLRETAAAVDAGPPWGVAEDAPGVVCSGDLRPWGAPTVAHNLDDGDAAWIALASPVIAEPLASWLTAIADKVGGLTRADQDVLAGIKSGHLWHALNIARVVLGEDS